MPFLGLMGPMGSRRDSQQVDCIVNVEYHQMMPHLYFVPEDEVVENLQPKLVEICS